MTDQTSTTDGNGAPEGGAEPTVQCHTQYVKDLSFENPNAIEAAIQEGAAPNVDMNVQIGISGVREGLFEVTLSIEGKAVRDGKHLFVVELDYGGLFTVENVPSEHLEPILYIHCASLLFPFARQIVAEVTRNGGFPPLLLNPIDFNALYQSQLAQRAETGNA